MAKYGGLRYSEYASTQCLPAVSNCAHSDGQFSGQKIKCPPRYKGTNSHVPLGNAPTTLSL